MDISLGMIFVILFVLVSCINGTRNDLKNIMHKMMDEHSGKSDPDFITKIEMKSNGYVYVVCHSDGKPVKDVSGSYKTYREKYDADAITKQLNNVGVVNL